MSEADDWRTDPAAFHREVAGRFSAVADGVRDWDAPAPVAGWTAQSVVEHLLDWLPGFLAGRGGPQLPEGPPVADDPAEAWRVRAAAVQAILDDEVAANQPSPGLAGDSSVAEVLHDFYAVDVFLHTWDLARASGQDDRLDPWVAEDLLRGMLPIEDLLRGSGHYGTERGALPPDPDPTDLVMSFVGRDAAWTPPASWRV